jgi:betaine-homocysteine S-methyltransferase
MMAVAHFSEFIGLRLLQIAAQPAAFGDTDETPCFTRMPQFPDALETIQVSRAEFAAFAKHAESEGIAYLGGCCGCNAAYVRAMGDALRSG